MKIWVLMVVILMPTSFQANARDTSEESKNTHQKQGLCSQRISYLLRQFNKNPYDGKLCNTIGFYFYESGNYESAIEYYKKAIKLTPEYPVSYNNLGVVYLKTDQLHLAEENFRRAIELDPKYIKAICNLAVVCFKLKKKDEALELYNEAKMLNPEYVEGRIARFKEMKHTTWY